MVIVGDLTGEGEAQERGVTGGAANLAARLQTIAAPDSVVIGPGARKLLGSLFEVRDLGAIEVRGLAAPVPAYCVLGLADVASRFEAFHGSEPLAPLVGRVDDLQILLRRWELAKAGQGSQTASAVIIDTGQNVATALQKALKSVQSKAIACEYKIPTTGVAPDKVNVSFTSGSGAATTIGHAMLDGTDGSGCDARGGWYYDSANPATTPPTKITACPASCSMFQTDLKGHVDVVLGCPTISVD